jgi:hypothetical protein
MNKEQLIKKAELSWEGCDSCTEQDEIMYKNGYVKGYNAAISESYKEISDEEIDKAYEFSGPWTAKEIMQKSTSFHDGVRWVINRIKQQDND